MQSTHRKKYLNNLVKLIQLADTFQDSNMKLKILIQERHITDKHRTTDDIQGK